MMQVAEALGWVVLLVMGTDLGWPSLHRMPVPGLGWVLGLVAWLAKVTVMVMVMVKPQGWVLM